MKKLCRILVLCGLLVTILCGTASAAIVDSGECGDNVTWTFDDTGTLAIKGRGRMWSGNVRPWYDYRYEIEYVTIDEGITSLSDYAFKELLLVTSISLPDTIEEIGDYAFAGCYSLTRIILPDNLKIIGDHSFSNCTNLKTVILSDGVTEIKDGAFSFLPELNSIDIPDSVTSLGDYVFFESGLVSVKIPNNIRFIRTESFYNCSNLESVTLPDSVTIIDESAFLFTNSLTDIYFEGSEEQWNAIKGKGPEYLAERSVTIHFGVDNPPPQPLSFNIQSPNLGVSVPLSITGSGTKSISFFAAVYDENHRFIGADTLRSTLFPGLQSVFIPLNTFTPTLKVFALDDDYRTLTAGQADTNDIALSDKYTAILNESNRVARNTLIDSLTEQEAKEFIKIFTEWFD